jgi:hypothetical protein
MAMSNWHLEPYDPATDDAPAGDCGLPDDETPEAPEDGDDDGA